MTDEVPDGVSGPGELCPLCQGQWIDGRIAVPIVGSLRFVYRLGTNEVTTEVDARLCQNCGHVDLRARDPELIDRARRAAVHGRAAQRWTFRAQRSAGDDHRSG